MSYRLDHDAQTITRLADNFTFPHDDRDPAYAEYHAWLAKGGTPEIAESAPPEPAFDVEKEVRALKEALVKKAVITKQEIEAEAVKLESALDEKVEPLK